MAERMKVLITVKTYPLPSLKYDEVVCTAGVLEDGRFVRLYPINYRYRPYWQWYKKYQWIEVDTERHANDPRPESYRPIGVITRVGQRIGTEQGWAERKRFVLVRGLSTMCDLQRRPQTEVSLSIIRPKAVRDLLAEPTDRAWKPQWTARLQQLRLFEAPAKPLEKIPYKFSYVFTCEDPDCSGHTKMIEDWELGELYRQMRHEYDELTACLKVREKFLDQICSASVGTHFYVGTVLSYSTWIILGTFWPPRGSESGQPTLPLF